MPDLVRFEVHEDLGVVAVVAAENTAQALAVVGEIYAEALESISGMAEPPPVSPAVEGLPRCPEVA